MRNQMKRELSSAHGFRGKRKETGEDHFWNTFFEPKGLAVCLLLAVLQGTVFVGVQVASTGVVSFPLDDSYIHLQYARQIAQGEYFRYQDHDPVSGGATSFLYAHVLAFGYFIGFRGDLFPLWVHGVSLLCVALTFYSLYQLGKRWEHPFAGGAAVALAFTSGLMAWGFWSGMEIALFSALLGITCVVLTRSEPMRPSFLILLGFLAMCRPEGQIISLIFLGYGMSHLLRGKKLADFITWKNTGALLFLGLSYLGPALYFRVMTGGWGGNGMLAKSLLRDPVMTLWEKNAAILSNLGAMLFFLCGGGEDSLGEYVLPGMLLWVLAGVGGWIGRESKLVRNGVLTVTFSLGIVFIAIATLEVWPLHNYRYLLPFFPLLFLLGMMGVESVSRGLGLRDRVLLQAVCVVAVLSGLIYCPTWVARYAENACTIYEKQIRAAKWMAKRLPSEARIAINDAGALAYYGKQEILDLVGLASNGPAIPYRMGEGGLYEWMEHLPDSQRPMYAAVFSPWFIETSQIFDVFYDPLVYFPDPFDPNFGKTVYRVNWSYAGMEDAPRPATMRPGWGVRDCLDVADQISEEAHRYFMQTRGNRFPKIPVPFRRNFGYHEEIEERWPDVENERMELIPFLRQQGILNQFDILDAGRRIEGRESFVLGNLTPGQDAYLVLRTCDCSGEQERFLYRMDVFADGKFVRSCEVEGTPWNWYETVVTLPGDLIRKESLPVMVINRSSPSFGYYDSFYYWICQKELN